MAALREQLDARGASPECQQVILALMQPREADRPLPRDALGFAWFHMPE